MSGFLSYYVLSNDVYTYGKIDYSKFLWRRILRIWPAYFFTIFIILAITGYWGELYRSTTNYDLLPYITFTYNFYPASWIDNGVSWLAPLWSIAVEEKFYLIAPIFFLIMQTRYLMLFLFCIFLIANFCRLYYLSVVSQRFHIRAS